MATVPVIVTYVFRVGVLLEIPSMALIIPTVFGNGEKVTITVAELLGFIVVELGFETLNENAAATLPRLLTL